MKLSNQFFLGLFIFGLMTAFVCSAQEYYKLIVPGSYHGDEVDAKDGEQWSAIIIDGQETILSESRLNIEPVYDPVLDDENGKSGKKVAVKGGGNVPLFLVKGLKMEGDNIKIPTSFSKPQILKDGDLINLSINDSSRVLLTVTGTKVEISMNGVRQAIGSVYSEMNETSLSLVWAGDLDGDGRVDLILNDISHYNTIINFRLFLSSEAGPNKIIKEVASFRAVGC